MKVYLINHPSTIKTVNGNIIVKSKGVFIENIIAPVRIEAEVSIDTNFHKNLYGFSLSNSEILNFMAHRIAWKQFLKTNESWCLIIEEDVHFCIDLSAINSTLQELPEDWEVFFPYEPYEYQITIDKTNTSNFFINQTFKGITDWEPYTMGYQWGNSNYFINRSGVEKLLDIRTIRQRLDDEMLALIDSKLLIAFTGEVEWFDYKKTTPVQLDDRNQLIWEAINKNSTWTTLLQKSQMRYLLKVMSEVAGKLTHLAAQVHQNVKKRG